MDNRLNSTKRVIARKKAIRRFVVIAACAALTVAGIFSLGRCSVAPEIRTEKVFVPIEVPAETTAVETKTEVLYVPVSDSNSFVLTPEERELVERVIAAEVRYGHLEDMIGIAQVIRDKAEHPNTALYYGPDITTVLAHGHATPWQGDLDEFPLIEMAVKLVFDDGYRLFDETTTIYFTPEASDPAELEILRQYTYVGSTEYFEFRSDKLEEV